MVITQIHNALQAKRLLPSQHLVDAGYPSAELLVRSQSDFGIDLFGPVRPDVRWQGQDEQAFDITRFQIDWDQQTVTCPIGKTSAGWNPDNKGPRGKPTIQINFRRQDCRDCEARAKCTRSRSAPRNLTLHPREQQLALQAARERQKTDAFHEIYPLRSGIEGTIGQAVDKLKMRRSRYRGLTKTHFQHLVTAAALNIQRVLSWLCEQPSSVAYTSHIALLATG